MSDELEPIGSYHLGKWACYIKRGPDGYVIEYGYPKHLLEIPFADRETAWEFFYWAVEEHKREKIYERNSMCS